MLKARQCATSKAAKMEDTLHSKGQSTADKNQSRQSTGNYAKHTVLEERLIRECQQNPDEQMRSTARANAIAQDRARERFARATKEELDQKVERDYRARQDKQDRDWAPRRLDFDILACKADGCKSIGGL